MSQQRYVDERVQPWRGGSALDVVDILTADHRGMVVLIGQIEHTSDTARRRDLADTVIAEVMRHAVAEEMYVCPAIEEHVPDGTEQVAHDKREHAEIVQLMKGPGVGMIDRLRDKLAGRHTG